MAKSPQVEEWLAKYDNPMKDVVLRIREIMLSDARLEECIKWQSPTFTFKGNLASFNPRSKQHASLMFHTGAQIPGEHPKLEGGEGTARFMKVASVEEADALSGDLKAIIDAWCELKDGAQSAPVKQAASKKSKKKASKKKSTAKKVSKKKSTAKKVSKKKSTAKKVSKKKSTAKKVSKKKSTAKKVSKKKSTAKKASKKKTGRAKRRAKKATRK